jgi:cell division protein FtsB
MVIVAVIALGAIVVGVLLEQVVLAQSAFKLEAINTRLSAAETKQEELLADMAQLESPGRIERYARERLGMIEPTSVEYIVAKVRMSTSNRVAAALEARNLPLPGSGTATAPLQDGANP